MAQVAQKKYKKILLITLSAGGGHLQAARAKAVKALQDDPQTIVVQKDMLIDWIGKRLGKFIVFLWNSSQKKGHVTFIRLFHKCLCVCV